MANDKPAIFGDDDDNKGMMIEMVSLLSSNAFPEGVLAMDTTRFKSRANSGDCFGASVSIAFRRGSTTMLRPKLISISTKRLHSCTTNL